MKYKKYIKLGILLSSVLVSTTYINQSIDVHAASKLRPLRTEVANLKKDIQELEKISKEKDSSSKRKSEESKQLKDTYDATKNEYEELKTKYESASDDDKKMLKEIEEVSKEANELKKESNKLVDEVKERNSKLEKDFAGTKLANSSNFEEFVSNALEVVQGHDSEVFEMQRKSVTLDLLASVEEKREDELRAKYSESDALEKVKKEFDTKTKERDDMIKRSEQLKSESDSEAKESQNALSELENKREKLEKTQAELNVVMENLYKEALNDPDTDFNGEEDQALLEKIKNDAKQDGLTSHTAVMANFLATKFNVGTVGGYRGDDDGTGHGHGSGMAIDLMVDSETGDKVAKYVTNNFEELGVYYLIWEQKYYMNMTNIYGPANTWNMMEDRGSITQNHYDHVHISFAK